MRNTGGDMTGGGAGIRTHADREDGDARMSGRGAGGCGQGRRVCRGKGEGEGVGRRTARQMERWRDARRSRAEETRAARKLSRGSATAPRLWTETDSFSSGASLHYFHLDDSWNLPHCQDTGARASGERRAASASRPHQNVLETSAPRASEPLQQILTRCSTSAAFAVTHDPSHGCARNSFMGRDVGRGREAPETILRCINLRGAALAGEEVSSCSLHNRAQCFRVLWWRWGHRRGRDGACPLLPVTGLKTFVDVTTHRVLIHHLTWKSYRLRFLRWSRSKSSWRRAGATASAGWRHRPRQIDDPRQLPTLSTHERKPPGAFAARALLDRLRRPAVVGVRVTRVVVNGLEVRRPPKSLFCELEQRGRVRLGRTQVVRQCFV